MRYQNAQGQYPVEENKNINWDVVKHAQKFLNCDCQIQMIKQVSGFCETGIKMKLWNFRETSACPLYNITQDNLHILCCKSNDATDRWISSIASLEQRIIDNHTHKVTVDMIVSQLHLWIGQTSNIPMCTSASLSPAILAHNLIGWQAFTEGCLSVEWKAHASTFLTNKQGPRRWTALLVKTCG